MPDGGMHAMATGLADAVVKGGADIRYDATVTRILRDGDGGVGRRRAAPTASASRPTSSSATSTCRWPTARCSAASTRRGPPAAAATRRRACCGWPACAALPPEGAAHHNIHFGEQWDESFQALIHDGELMPDPSILVTLHSLDDASLAPPGCSTLYALEPVPNLDGRVDWTQRREQAVERLRRSGRRRRLPDRRRDRGDLRPARLGGAGHGAGHAVRAGPHVPPDRAVPPPQRRPPRPRPRLRRLVDGARRRRADGAGVRASWPPPGCATMEHRPDR